MWRRALGSRRGRAIVAVFAAWAVWNAWLSLHAPSKIAPAIPRSGDRAVDVLVTLPFVPERFHVLVFQKFGRVSGTADHQIELRGVRPSDLTAVARPYWVSHVDPLPTDQRR